MLKLHVYILRVFILVFLYLLPLISLYFSSIFLISICMSILYRLFIIHYMVWYFPPYIDMFLFQAEQDREMDLLRNAVTDAERKIQLLQDQVEELESKIVPSIAPIVESLDKSIEQHVGLIYLIGGFDGCSWLSTLDGFSPSLNIITPLKSMSSARSYASAVSLDSSIYVFGGGDGHLWFDSGIILKFIQYLHVHSPMISLPVSHLYFLLNLNVVECYNRCHDEWTECPSMKLKKGSLAGATLNGKIFAIGGGDGVDCFSDVEVFDPVEERWINYQSMLHTVTLHKHSCYPCLLLNESILVF